MSIHKNIKLIALVMIVTISACDVEMLPETQLSDPAFWKSENDLKAATNYLYTSLPTLPVTSDIWSDDGFERVANSISDGSRTVPSTDQSYNGPYRFIRAANSILEKSSRIIESGVAPDVVDVYLGETRFFRAWSYFNLVQRYGDVPLILQTLAQDAPELTAPRNSRAEIFEAMYADLDFAIEKLPTITQRTATTGNAFIGTYGRITKTAALAFKSRVALFEGTRSKFHGYGDANAHLTLAAQAAKACMDSNEHGIFASYFNLFQYQGEGRQNRENVMVRQYGLSFAGDQVNRHDSQRGLEQGRVNPTKALVDSYLMTDGLPIDQSPLYKTPTKTTEVFTNRDRRLSETVFKTGDAYIGTQPLYTVAGLNNQVTGFGTRKYQNVQDWNNNWSFIDHPVIRYAEVLLNYAEATFELNGSISDADLALSINLLRTRAGLPALTNAFISANESKGLTMRGEIRRERRVELALEGFRYWDLIRWKTAEVELKKPVLGNFFFASEYPANANPNRQNGFILLQAADRRFFNPAKDYLWPIPTNEIALNRI